MMTVFGLLLSIFIPTLLGIAVVRLQLRQRPPNEAQEPSLNWPFVIGYGGIVGALLATVLMRVSSLLGIAWNFWLLSAVMLGLAILLHLISQNNRRGAVVSIAEELSPTVVSAPTEAWLKWLFYGLLALLVLRFLNLSFEVLQRPLYPWDAWTQWATKAKVFFEYKGLMSFATLDSYLSADATAVYTDAAPTYPPTVAILQAFSALSIGRFDDALINVPWLSCWAFLCCAFYGQARNWGMSAMAAMLATYALGSLPFINTHVALAGYAELHMATVFGLGAIAFFSWAKGGANNSSKGNNHNKRQLFLAVFLLLACLEIKRPGVFWLLSILPGVLVWWRPRLGLVVLAASAILLIVAGLVFAKSGITFAGFRVGQDLTEVSLPIIQNTFLMGNWNLLFFFGIAIMVMAWRSLLQGVYAVLTAVVFAGCTFLFIVFYFRISAYVSDFTTINRAVVHLVPVLVFYFATLAWARVQQLGTMPSDHLEFYRGRMQNTEVTRSAKIGMQTNGDVSATATVSG
jgi:hypothetical protein